MKRTLTATAVALAAVSAHAYIDVNIDVPNQIVNRPAAGTVDVLFTGSVDVEFGYDARDGFLDFPGLTLGGPFLVGVFDPAFLTYLGGASPNVDYAGSLFTITVSSTDALGLYSLNALFGGPAAELIVDATDGLIPKADAEQYTVNVVPEPASIAVLGIGVAALLRRKRR